MYSGGAARTERQWCALLENAGVSVASRTEKHTGTPKRRRIWRPAQPRVADLLMLRFRRKFGQSHT